MLPGVSRRGVFRLVLGNPRLRRVVFAFAAFNLADWARWLSVLIYAFTRGGAAEAGAVSLLQLLPAALIAPLAASLGDRLRRDRVLLFSYVAQASFMAATAAAILSGSPAAVVYALAVVGACAITITRPAHGALLPWVARTPAELVAGNAASGMMEGLGILSGQAIAGIILQLAIPGISLLVAGFAASLAAAAVLRLGVAVPARAAAADTSAGPGSLAGLRTELLGGLVALARLPGPRTIVLLLGLAAVVWGALDVLVPVLAINLAHIGPSGVGFLNAVMGFGGLVGSAVALSFGGRIRLALPFLAGLLIWGMPLAGIGLLPMPLVAGALLVCAGAGRTVMDVLGRTLLQRAAPDAVLTRVLGVVEGLYMAAFGLGAIIVPGLIAAAGPEGAFVIVGLLLPAAAVVAWNSLRAIDRDAHVPVRELTLLRGIPMFAPLAPAVLERLANNLEPVRAAAGEVVIRQGDAGDRVYLIVGGEVEFLVDGGHRRREGPGGLFGEIALLRRVPRTATVIARTDLELLALHRDVFLAAVAGDAASRLAADRIVAERLGALPGPPAAESPG